MNSKNLKGLCEAYGGIYAPQELTEEQVWEEVETWVSSLIEEGYDLSDYTWEEMFEAYLNEAPTYSLDDNRVTRFASRIANSNNPVLKYIRNIPNPLLMDASGRVTQNKPTTQVKTTPKNRFEIEKERLKKVGDKPETAAQIDARVKALNAKKEPPAAAPVTPTTAQRPAAASGPVLSKKDGVEGTGVGADFKARAFSAAEKSRYSSVAAQNAARTSASSATPIPSNASSATASTADKIKGGMNVYNKQMADKDVKGATETGKNISSLKFGSPEDRKAKTIGTRNPLMDKTFGYQTGNSPKDQQARADDIVKGGAVAALKPVTPTPARNGVGVAAAPIVANSSASSATAPPTPGQNSINNTNPQKKEIVKSSYEWPSAKTIRDIAGAYASIYEAKKKVDQDQDGDNDFADVIIARMIASGVPKEKAIAMVKDKSYNEEVELWVNELIEEGYDLSEYTWDDMFDIYEATRMGKELGREGEIATRKELAARSNAYQRSGSVDRTIAAAERGAERPYVKNIRGESDANRAARKRKQSQTLSGLAASRRGSVRDKPRAGLRGYAAVVKGSDKELQNARSSARAAGTLTPREKKELNREAYETYEFVASYLLENNFANTVEDANVIINNMSENWFESIMEDIRGASYTPNPIGNAIRAGAGLLKNTINRPSVQGAIKTGSQMLQKSVPSGGYSTREGDGKPRETPLWDGPSKPTPTTPTKPQTKKQPPMRDEPLW